MMASEPSPSTDPYSLDSNVTHDPKFADATRQRMLFESQTMQSGANPVGSSGSMMPSHYSNGMSGSTAGAAGFRQAAAAAALEYAAPYSNPMTSYASSSFATGASPYTSSAAAAGMGQDSFFDGTGTRGQMYASAAGLLPSSIYNPTSPAAAQLMQHPGHAISSSFRNTMSSSYPGLSPTSAMLLSSGAGVAGAPVGGAGGFSQAELFDHHHHQTRQSLMGGGAMAGGFHPAMDGAMGAAVAMEPSMYGNPQGMMGIPPNQLDLGMTGFGGGGGGAVMPSSFSTAISSAGPRRALENSNAMLFSSAAGPNDTHNNSNSATGSYPQEPGRTQQDPRNPSSGGGASGEGTFAVQTFHKAGTPPCPLVKSIPMAMASDNEFITPLHCFIRLHCVELFTATQDDVFTPSKGKRRPIQLHQVGIRCPHCHGCNQGQNTKIGHERGSVYYPNNISSIYNATMNLLQRHLHVCDFVPKEIMKMYNELKADDARSGTSKRYWIDSALALGLFDTPTGIRWCNPAISTGPTQSSTTPSNISQPLRGDNSHSGAVGGVGDYPYSALQGNDNLNMNPAMMHGAFGTMDQNLAADVNSKGGGSSFTNVSLVHTEDKHLSTRYSFALLSQMRACKFTEADRLGKRKGLPIGFSGLACSHCYGGYGSGRFFPSTIKTMSDTSKTLNVLHSHMMKCRKCPDDVRERLVRLRDSHDEERARMKFGSQKAFFVNIWQRLHGEMPPRINAIKRKRFSHPDSKERDERTKHANRVMASFDMSGSDICNEAVPQLQQL